MRTFKAFSFGLACLLLVAACGDDDDDVTPTIDAPAPGIDAAAPGVDAPAANPADRGEYIMLHAAACIDCHTPRLEDGSFDMTKLMAGVPNEFDLVPGDDTMGGVSAKNLTPDEETGLGTWTDAEIKNAFQNGIEKDGSPLFPIMPYWLIHNITDEDADAIVAYLRSLPAVSNPIPARQPLPFPFTQPAAPVPVEAFAETTLAEDDPDYAKAEAGQYIVTRFGACVDCHTEQSAPGTPVPIDVTKILAGGRIFLRTDLGLPEGFPDMIYTRNLTPDVNGLSAWAVDQIATALLHGTDDEGTTLCPPMPAGPMGAFGGLTQEDAEAIGYYLTTIPAIDNGQIPNCTPPGGP